MAKIICEFDSQDLADLSLGRLRRQCRGIDNIVIRQRTSHKREKQTEFYVPLFLNNMSYNAHFEADPLFPEYGAGATDMETANSVGDPEPYRIRSVVAEFDCPDSECEMVTGKLVSLGATQIKVR